MIELLLSTYTIELVHVTLSLWLRPRHSVCTCTVRPLNWSCMFRAMTALPPTHDCTTPIIQLLIINYNFSHSTSLILEYVRTILLYRYTALLPNDDSFTTARCKLLMRNVFHAWRTTSRHHKRDNHKDRANSIQQIKQLITHPAVNTTACNKS